MGADCRAGDSRLVRRDKRLADLCAVRGGLCYENRASARKNDAERGIGGSRIVWVAAAMLPAG